MLTSANFGQFEFPPGTIMAEGEDGQVLPYVASKNPISMLQEVAQVWRFSMPAYRECEGSYQEFGTEVTFTLSDKAGSPGATIVLNALGRTKKASKSKAAQDMLECIAKSHPHLLQRPELPPAAADDDMPSSWKKGQYNPQHVSSVNQDQLARETEVLGHLHVSHDLSRLIGQSRIDARLTQKDLAARINEKVGVVIDYESGKAVPNQQVIAKIERAVGVHLRGEKAGQAKIIGRGKHPTKH